MQLIILRDLMNNPVRMSMTSPMELGKTVKMTYRVGLVVCQWVG